MFALAAISILLIGIYGQFTDPNPEQQDAILQQYKAQVTQVLEQASHGIKCYTDYVPRVEHESTTLSEVLSVDTCDEAYYANTLHLRDARNTARQHNFTRAKLLDNKLPYVLNAQQEGQDTYTETFQIKLQQLQTAANSAQKVFRAKRDVAMKAIEETESKVKEESSKHAKEITAGIAVGGVIVTGGVVTFAPFVAQATKVADHVEKMEAASYTVSGDINRVRQTPFAEVTLGQLMQLRRSLSQLSSDILEANNKLSELIDQYSNVVQAEKPEAIEIIERYSEEITTVLNCFNQLEDMTDERDYYKLYIATIS